MPKTPVAVVLVAALMCIPARAVELKPQTTASFDRYIAAVEARMDREIRENRFLALDSLPASRRQRACDDLHQGKLYIEALHASEDGRQLHIQDGLLNHWVGVLFIPGATLADVISVLHDYNRHDELYQPVIRRSRLLEQNGDHSQIYFQLFYRSMFTVVLNANFDVTDTQFGATRHQIALRSTRIADVEDWDKPDAHELPVGNDHGYLWRFNSYWRLEEADGGVYLQNESVALSRSVPTIFAWLFSSLTHGIPRDILTHLLTDTRNAVVSSLHESQNS